MNVFYFAYYLRRGFKPMTPGLGVFLESLRVASRHPLQPLTLDLQQT